MQTDIVDNIIRQIKSPKDLDNFCKLNKHNYVFCRTYKNSIIKKMLGKSGVNYKDRSDDIYEFHKVIKDDYMMDNNYNFPRIYKELFIPLFEGRVYYEYKIDRVSESEFNENNNNQILQSMVNLIHHNNSKIVTIGPIDDSLTRQLKTTTFTRKNREELDVKTRDILDGMVELNKSWSDDEYEEYGDIEDFYPDSWTEVYKNSCLECGN
jgi:hypothetical protein